MTTTPDSFAERWRTSTRSAQQGACVEVAITDAAVGVRDTKNRAAGHLTVQPGVWATFTDKVQNGTFDLPN